MKKLFDRFRKRTPAPDKKRQRPTTTVNVHYVTAEDVSVDVSSGTVWFKIGGVTFFAANSDAFDSREGLRVVREIAWALEAGAGTVSGSS